MRNKPQVRWLFGGAMVLSISATARAEDEYERVTLTTNVIYLIVPVFTLDAELAVHPKWSVGVRGGAGQSKVLASTIVELGAQGTYYLTGSARRGVQLGLDTRYVSYEGDGLFAGLGDGLAVGPFVGYKRVFGSGITLGGKLGAQVVVTGDSDGPVIPYAAASVGVAFWSSGNGANFESPSVPTQPTNPLDAHHGLLIGFSLGGGILTLEGCNACRLEPGVAIDAALGWFVGRRFAVMVDSTGAVALFSLSSGLGSFGFGLTSLAVQYWPHEKVWLKAGIGFAQAQSISTGGFGLETGGGGTAAVGYELHQDRSHSIDLQLRVAHGSFHNSSFDGVNSFAGLVGFHWY